ncbi:MAG: hypothetical protein LBU44_01230 [Mediterranea sp.]|jgi:enamine deaminase RidA (YjgF/YER057c/UK114 family)|nr:hypothetical protein [Mediterranea sp.]
MNREKNKKIQAGTTPSPSLLERRGVRLSQKTFPAYGVKAEIAAFQPQGGTAEYHIMLHGDGDAVRYEDQLINLHKAYGELLSAGWPANPTPVMKRYFLSDAANQTEALEKELERFPACAVSIVQQPPLDGSKIALWVYLVGGVEFKEKDGLSGFSRNGYHHYWTAGRSIASGSPASQTRELLEDYGKALARRGCTIAENCVRTWFFVQNVDVNYAGMVKARKENFMEQGLTEQTHYIASTGIEGRAGNPAAHVLLDAYAVGGIQKEQVNYLYALTHLNRTCEYGVTFERGVSMEYGDRKQLYISGTASIDNKGLVLHVGDVVAQTRRMWENVGKLLEEGGAGFEDVAQMIVYLRDASDYPVVKKMFDEQFPDIPKQYVLAPVCRPAWLIEMECITLKENREERFGNY